MYQMSFNPIMVTRLLNSIRKAQSTISTKSRLLSSDSPLSPPVQLRERSSVSISLSPPPSSLSLRKSICFQYPIAGRGRSKTQNTMRAADGESIREVHTVDAGSDVDDHRQRFPDK